MKNFASIGVVVAAIVTIVLMIYSCYWAAKTVSYKVFYRDMVRTTITEMVKPEALKTGVK